MWEGGDSCALGREASRRAAPCASLRKSVRGRDEDAEVGGRDEDAEVGGRDEDAEVGGGQRGGGSRGGRMKGQGRFDPAIFNRGIYTP